jgi:hypothetical protein
MPIPAITIHQPFASLILQGLKTWETRTWPVTKHTPPFYWLLHAATGRGPCLFMPPSLQLDDSDLPHGVFLAVIKIDRQDHAARIRVPRSERLVGDFRPPRFAYHVDAVYPFRYLVRCPGQQGIWNPPPWVRPALMRALRDSAAAFILDRLAAAKLALYSSASACATLPPSKPLNTWENGPGW